jgi:hypothetical protein
MIIKQIQCVLLEKFPTTLQLEEQLENMSRTILKH